MKIDRYIIKTIMKTSIEYVFIISLGILLIFLDEIEFAGLEIKYLILILAGFKSSYFFIKGFRRISEFSGLDLKYYEFLVFIAFNISVIVLSFGFDFLCIYKTDLSSFSGIPQNLGYPSLFFKFVYFSLMIFTNIGIIKIVPESTEAEILVIFEAILSFITIIFILSDFLSLKESLSGSSSKKGDLS
ncbi:ion transporter [Leptospira hartskeerlii]|uniref:Ion transporter n=1 Tax=Leptospira hartskeerlii TaxID=2023177 RepID=A0A2M9XEJ4_9LEPT|nr:ion transporter [Leptospira hartskeerlii]PJZ26106.1 ion transporter [Leptospira hartskeerlii]PJZ34190.1 ion transporter [Leptospira hartskeerlii]